MPKKAVSHSARQSAATKSVADKAYGATQRQHGTLKAAKAIRSSARWQKLRALKLHHDPVCEDPMRLHPARAIVARQVDHILALAIAPEAAFVWENLQSLCDHCHAVKSAEERRHASP